MRMRKKKHGEERISACAEYITSAPTSDFADNTKPLCLEIGCGKGRFITTLAKAKPENNYFAIEKISDVILLALEKTKAEEIKNLLFARTDAKNLSDFLPPCSVDTVYLNFNDPWPKKGYYKRRLTYTDYLNIYKAFLKPGGKIILKTDNIDYFNFSLEMFEQNGFSLSEITNDLHSSEYERDNIHTEYEDNFTEKGFCINRCVATLK